ncbi:MAG: MEDS domain-containing protein [Usitatibacter sp.]
MASTAKRANVRTESFWGELSPREHSVQIYGSDAAFMDALEGYVSAGLRRGDSVVLISTAAHLHDLEKRLRANWIDLDRARWEERYIALLAQESLGRFMVEGMPDEALFIQFASGVLKRARGPGARKVRAFGEMVAILWGQGSCAAAIALETLWNRLQAVEEFPLFCAYPREGFKEDASASMHSVCAAHSRIIPGYA